RAPPGPRRPAGCHRRPHRTRPGSATARRRRAPGSARLDTSAALRPEPCRWRTGPPARWWYRHPCRVEAASPFHEHRAGAARRLVLAHDPQALGDLRIGLEEAAEIAAEAVLVQLLVRLDVPQPARVGRDLVGHDDAHHVVFPQAPAFHLEVDQADADAEEEAAEDVVDADGERHGVVGLLRGRPAERRDVLLRPHRIAKRVVLVVELDDRARQLRALLDAEPLAERAGRDVAHHDLERDDLHLANQLLAHVEAADEMRRHPDIVEVLEDVFRDAVVEDALPVDHLVLFRVEGGRVVLEMLNQRTGLRPLVKDLRLAFIDAAAAAHRDIPWLEKIHLCRGSHSLDSAAPAGWSDSTSERPCPSVQANLSDRPREHNRGAFRSRCGVRDTAAAVDLAIFARYAR